MLIKYITRSFRRLATILIAATLGITYVLIILCWFFSHILWVFGIDLCDWIYDNTLKPYTPGSETSKYGRWSDKILCKIGGEDFY